MPSVSKHHGLWSGLAIAWRSKNPGLTSEFKSEYSPFTPLVLQNSLRIAPQVTSLKECLSRLKNSFFSRSKVLGGKIIGR